MLTTNIYYILKRCQPRGLHIISSDMTYDHLEAIINILTDKERLVQIKFHGSRSGNNNIKTSDDKWEELQGRYKPGCLLYEINIDNNFIYE